jgi:hypothetical protein
MADSENVLQTLKQGGRLVRKVSREDQSDYYEAFQYKASDGSWCDYQPTVQERLAFVAVKLAGGGAA